MSQILFTIPVFVTAQIFGPIRFDFTSDNTAVDSSSPVKAGAGERGGGTSGLRETFAVRVGERDKFEVGVETFVVDDLPARQRFARLRKRVWSLRALVTWKPYKRHSKGSRHAMDIDADATPLLPPLSRSYSAHALVLPKASSWYPENSVPTSCFP